MAKFNTRTARARTTSPVRGDAQPSGRTFEGGAGYAREAKGELFLLAVTNMGSEKTFYESAASRDSRYAHLIRQVAAEDPAWLRGFLPWLRTEAWMRTAPVAGVVEAVRAMVDAGIPGGRALTAAVPGRADEPGEIMAYHYARYGRKLPKALKRGLADACDRVYTQRSLLKYDTPARAFRFADVIEQCRPRGRAPADLLDRAGIMTGTGMTEEGAAVYIAVHEARQGALYKYAIDRRHNRGNPIPGTLSMVFNNDQLRRQAEYDPSALLHTDWLRQAGMTWENGLSLAGSRVPKAKLWEAFIPVMGVEALLKNLRNFDQAGVSDEAAAIAAAKISSADDVRASRQFPMRFLAAYRAAPSLRWSYPLEQGLALSLANVPALSGRTLVLVDTSGSMNEPFSKDGDLMRWHAAAIFGLALAQRCAEADVVSFSGRSYYHQARQAVTLDFPLKPGESLLRSLERWNAGYFFGGGTDTDLALAKHYAKHDRVVIITDEQAAGNAAHMTQVAAQRPENIPLYTFNIAGYKFGHAPAGLASCHAIGGLTDTSFKTIGLLERGRDAAWPWAA